MAIDRIIHKYRRLMACLHHNDDDDLEPIDVLLRDNIHHRGVHAGRNSYCRGYVYRFSNCNCDLCRHCGASDDHSL
jgi:hypothetical protein